MSWGYPLFPTLAQTPSTEKLLEECRALLAQKSYDQAAWLSSQLIREQPGLAEAYSIRSRVHEEQRDYSKALNDLSIAVGLEPEQAEYRFRRGLIAYQSNRLDLARSDFRTVLRLRAPITQTVFYRQKNQGGTDRILTVASGVADQLLHYLALTEIKAGSYGRALELLDSAIALNNKDADLFAHRGLARERTGDTYGAQSDYKRAFDLEPGNEVAMRQRARQAVSEGRSTDAEVGLTQAIENNPRSPQPYAERAYMRFQQGRYEESRQDYDSAIRLDPTDDELLMNRGLCLEKLGRLSEASRDYQSAIEINDRSPKAWFLLGSVCYRIALYKEAVEYLTLAIRLQPDYASAYYNRALARFQLKQGLDACHDLRQATDLGASVPQQVRRKVCAP